jgi:hypothetical protein
MSQRPQFEFRRLPGRLQEDATRKLACPALLLFLALTARGQSNLQTKIADQLPPAPEGKTWSLIRDAPDSFNGTILCGGVTVTYSF